MSLNTDPIDQFDSFMALRAARQRSESLVAYLAGLYVDQLQKEGSASIVTLRSALQQLEEAQSRELLAYNRVMEDK